MVPVRYDYNDNKWIIDPLATPTDLRCIPTDKINNNTINGHIFKEEYLNKIPTWILNSNANDTDKSTMKIPEEMCNMVRKDNIYIEGGKKSL